MNVAGLCPLAAEDKREGLDRYNLFFPSSECAVTGDKWPQAQPTGATSSSNLVGTNNRKITNNGRLLIS
jgi:hypothetical protein